MKYQPSYTLKSAQEIDAEKQKAREQEQDRIITLANSKKMETDKLKHKTEPESRRARANSYIESAKIFATGGFYFNPHAISDYQKAINILNLISKKQDQDLDLQIDCYLGMITGYDRECLDRLTSTSHQIDAKKQIIDLLLKINPVNYAKIAKMHEELAHNYFYLAGLHKNDPSKITCYLELFDHALKAAELGINPTSMFFLIAPAFMLASECKDFTLTEEQAEKIELLKQVAKQTNGNPSVALVQTVQSFQSDSVLSPVDLQATNNNNNSEDKDDNLESFSGENFGFTLINNM